MTREEIGFVVACSILIAIIIGGIFTDWYGVQRDQRPAPPPFGTAKPTRPINIYYLPGEPAPKVPGDPGWRKS